jgi:virginiamycin B lyase
MPHAPISVPGLVGRSLGSRLGCIIVAGALAAAGCGGDDDERRSPSPAATEQAALQKLPPAAEGETDVRKTGATAVAVENDWMAAGAGAVWLTGQNRVLRLDPETGRTVATVEVPQAPCLGTVTGFGAMWTATCTPGGLARIDPATNQVSDHLPLAVASATGGEGSIGAGRDGIWLVVDGPGCSGCRLARVDPESMRVTVRVRVAEGSASVRGDGRFVWVTQPDASTVQQVDARRARVVRTVRVGTAPLFLAVAYGAAWTLNQVDGTVTRVDARTGKTTTVRADLAAGGNDIAAGGGWVWARASTVLLVRIDPRTSKVVERYGPAVGGGNIAVGFGAVWIGAIDVNALWRMPIPAG